MSVFDSSSDKKIAKLMVQYQRNVKDSVHIINTTVSPEVFFDRYDILLETLRFLTHLDLIIDFKGEKPGGLHTQLEKERDFAVEQFILRSYGKAITETAKLKTRRGQQNRVERFFDDMSKHARGLSEHNIQLLNNLVNQSAQYLG